jgi:hypothetical protein
MKKPIILLIMQMYLSFETVNERRVFSTRRARRERLAFWEDISADEVQLHHRNPKSFLDKRLRVGGEDIKFGEEVRNIENQIPVTKGKHGAAHYFCGLVLRRSGYCDLADSHFHNARCLFGQITDPQDAVESFVMGIMGAILVRKIFEMPNGREGK